MRMKARPRWTEEERITPSRLWSQSPENKMPHTSGPVSERSQLVILWWGGGEERQIYVGEVVWRWLTGPDTHTLFHRFHRFISLMSSLFHPLSLSLNLFLSLTLSAGDEVMPPRPALPLCSPRSHACYYQKPLTLGTKELRRHAASFIRNELSLTLVARGDLLLSLRWHEKQGSGGGQALTFLHDSLFFPLRFSFSGILQLKGC